MALAKLGLGFKIFGTAFGAFVGFYTKRLFDIRADSNVPTVCSSRLEQNSFAQKRLLLDIRVDSNVRAVCSSRSVSPKFCVVSENSTFEPARMSNLSARVGSSRTVRLKIALKIFFSFLNPLNCALSLSKLIRHVKMDHISLVPHE